MMLTSKENNKELENLYNKFLEILNVKDILAPYLMSPLSKITNPQNTSELKLVKDSNSKRVNDLLKQNTTPVTLYDNLFLFRNTDKMFELKRDLLKMITIKNYNVDLASLSDKNLMYDFAKGMYFDVKAPDSKSTRDRTLIL